MSFYVRFLNALLHQPEKAVNFLRDAFRTEIKVTCKADVTIVVKISCQHATCVTMRAQISDLRSINSQNIGYSACPVPDLAGI